MSAIPYVVVKITACVHVRRCGNIRHTPKPMAQDSEAHHSVATGFM